MKKRRNKPVIGMIVVLMILIVLFTTIAEAKKREKRDPDAAPSAEATAVSTDAQQAAQGRPPNERYEVTVHIGENAKTYVYDSLDEIKKDTSLSTEETARNAYATNAKPIYETPLGDFAANKEFPSNPEFAMDATTGKFVRGLASGLEGPKEILEPAQDGLGNYEIKRGDNVVRRGIKVQMRDDKGQPKTGENAFAIQEEDLYQKTVTFRVRETTTKPMSLEMYKKLLGDTGEMIKGVSADGSTIETVSGATYIVKEDTTTITNIKVNTVEVTRGDKPTTYKEYNFETTGIRGEEVDGKIVLNMQDGTKIYTTKRANEFEQGIATSGGITAAKVQGRSYEYTLKHDNDGKVTINRNIDGDAEDITIEKGGVKTETRYTTKEGKVVDFERSEKTDASGRVVERVERTSKNFLDVGKIDFGLFGKFGGYDSDKLKRTVYGPDGKTYTQIKTIPVNENTGLIAPISSDPKALINFEIDAPLINYDLDTGQIRSYPATTNPNDPKFDPKGGELKATVGTKLGFGGLFGVVPGELKDKIKSLPPAQQEAIKAEYKEGAAKDRTARFSSAQDFAQTFGQLSSLFADNGAFKAWSRRTDVLFNNWIMGGSEYRVSKICESNLRKIPANVLVVQTPGGQLVTAAFVNGERQAFKNPINNSVEYLYKISYKVNIPESLIDKAEVHMRQRIRAIDDPVPAPPARILRKDPGTGQRLEEFLAEGPFFNVILFGKSGRKCLFIDSGSKKCEGESVKKGANAVQRNMFVKYSPNDYTRVCIEFTRSLEFANRKANSICADIVGVNDQPRNVVDVPEAPTENPSIGEDGTSSGATAGPISTTATGQITTADI